MANFEGIVCGAVVAAAGALGISGVTAYRNKKTTDKLDITLRDLERKGTEQISQSIIDTAVRKAADRKAEAISIDIREGAKRTIRAQVDDAVNAVINQRRSEIVKAVDDRLTPDSIQIDKERLSKEVYANALNRITNDLVNDIRKKAAAEIDAEPQRTEQNIEKVNIAQIIDKISCDIHFTPLQKQSLIESLIDKM